MCILKSMCHRSSLSCPKGPDAESTTLKQRVEPGFRPAVWLSGYHPMSAAFPVNMLDLIWKQNQAGSNFQHPIWLHSFKEGPDHIVQNWPGSDLDGLVRCWPSASGPEASQHARIIQPASSQHFWTDPDRIRHAYWVTTWLWYLLLTLFLPKNFCVAGAIFSLGNVWQPGSVNQNHSFGKFAPHENAWKESGVKECVMTTSCSCVESGFVMAVVWWSRGREGVKMFMIYLSF